MWYPLVLHCIVIIYFGNNKGRQVRTKYLAIKFDFMALKKCSNLRIAISKKLNKNLIIFTLTLYSYYIMRII